MVVVLLLYIFSLIQSCNHVAAMLLKVDFCWRHGYVNPSCTSRPCTWNTGKKSMVVQPQQICDMEWRSPHAERIGNAPNNMMHFLNISSKDSNWVHLSYARV